MNKSSPAKSTTFFGNRGRFSATAFKTLLDQGISISQVFCSGFAPASAPKTNLPISKLESKPEPMPGSESNLIEKITAETIDSLANKNGIPLHYITNQTELNSLNPQEYKKPDFILVTCFPFRLPESIINWPETGTLNIHPSLLPKYRGPDPIFWQLHNGESQTGVSLHLVTSNIDSGPIVKQESCPYYNGAKRQEIESSLAKKGAMYFIATLARLLATGENLNGLSKQQDDSKSSYDHHPSVENFIISSDWCARQAFNFIQGTCSPTGHYVINTGHQLLNIIAAIDYNDKGILSGSASYYEQTSKNELLIQFSPGILRVKSV